MIELLLYLGLAYLIAFPFWVLWSISKGTGEFHGYDATKDDIGDFQ